MKKQPITVLELSKELSFVFLYHPIIGFDAGRSQYPLVKQFRSTRKSEKINKKFY
ncbi:MAG: hypothetical protein ACD_17C00407G0002 [uncultured bacterium]|nr:MAG: hypothetical protein ACD_17C00407G0002 [uncultured bacterium]